MWPARRLNMSDIQSYVWCILPPEIHLGFRRSQPQKQNHNERWCITSISGWVSLSWQRGFQMAAVSFRSEALCTQVVWLKIKASYLQAARLKTKVQRGRRVGREFGDQLRRRKSSRRRRGYLCCIFKTGESSLLLFPKRKRTEQRTGLKRYLELKRI